MTPDIQGNRVCAAPRRIDDGLVLEASSQAYRAESGVQRGCRLLLDRRLHRTGKLLNPLSSGRPLTNQGGPTRVKILLGEIASPRDEASWTGGHPAHHPPERPTGSWCVRSHRASCSAEV